MKPLVTLTQAFSEVSHWRTDEQAVANDEEVIAAAEPSMAMCPDGGLLLLASSVHRRSGLMYRKYRELFGNDAAEDICWFAPSPTMNPSLPSWVIPRALAENEARAKAEFLNEWRDDVAAFIPAEAIEACTDFGTPERAPSPNSAITYTAFVDSATGQGPASFAFAIAHRTINDKNRTITLDLAREYRPAFVIGHVIAELADLCRRYRITEVVGDAFASGFHAEAWAIHHIKFIISELTANEIYLNAAPLIIAPGRVRLCDNAVLRSQFSGLEHKVHTGGRESVKPTGQDDVAVCAAGAIVLAAQRPVYNLFSGAFDLDDELPPQSSRGDAAYAALLKRYGQPVRMVR
jgi:hypothetical protein